MLCCTCIVRLSRLSACEAERARPGQTETQADAEPARSSAPSCAKSAAETNLAPQLTLRTSAPSTPSLAFPALGHGGQIRIPCVLHCPSRSRGVLMKTYTPRDKTNLQPPSDPTPLPNSPLFTLFLNSLLVPSTSALPLPRPLLLLHTRSRSRSRSSMHSRQVQLRPGARTRVASVAEEVGGGRAVASVGRHVRGVDSLLAREDVDHLWVGERKFNGSGWDGASRGSRRGEESERSERG